MKKKPDKKVVLAILVLVAGVASASVPKSLTEAPQFHKKSFPTGALRA